MLGIVGIGLAFDAAIPRDTRFELGVVCGIQPRDTTTPTKASDGSAVGITAVFAGPLQGGI